MWAAIEATFDPVFRDAFGKMLLSIACGLMIGLERTYRGKPAGVRTNILICLGSCLFMIVSEQVSVQARNAGYLSADPARIAAQVVTGIGFLGAGTILRNAGIITGLTSAASIWVVAAVGLGIGAGLGKIAFAGTLLVVVVVETFGFVVRRIRVERFRYYRMDVVVKKDGVIGDIRKALRKKGIVYSQESVEKVLGERHYRAELYVRSNRPNLEEELASIEGVRHVVLLLQHVE